MSLNGYTRLTDSYHPDEFRYAVYTGPFEPKVQKKNDAGSFTISFTCKPQRYLLSGETETTIGQGGGDTISGTSLVVAGSVIDPSILKMKPLYTPASGTPTAPVSMETKTEIGFWLYKIVRPVAVQIDTYDSRIMVGLDPLSPLDTDCVLSGEIDLLTGSGTADMVREAMPKTVWTYSNGVFKNGGALGVSSISACTHYKPKTGQQADGQVWIANGELNVTDARFTTAADFMAYLADEDVYMAGPPSTTVSLSVATYSPNFPTGYNLRFDAVPATSEIVLGYNPTGNFENPTYMKARPLITATVNSSSGGAFTINNDTVTIGTGVEEVVIDCEMQDCYYGSTNLNDKVSFSPTYDFPVLNPGNNEITITNGITKLVIKPRWWRL